MKCFYHNDIDGRCAGAIVAQFTGNYNPIDYYEVDYVMALPLGVIEQGETVYFVDYSFKKNTMDILNFLLDKECEIIWIDHHTSSVKLVEEFPSLNYIQGIRQEGISGAALTYMYLYNKEFAQIPYYIKLVSDYDCWQFKYDPDTTYFKLGLESDIYNALDKVWIELADHDNLYRLSGGFLESMPLPQTANGKIIKKYVDADNKLYRDCYAYEAEIAGYTALVVNKKSNSWIFGEKYNEYPIVCIWVFDGEVYTYSIFSSNPIVNCSEIAESFGGGGHKRAAGFSSKELLFKKNKLS